MVQICFINMEVARMNKNKKMTFVILSAFIAIFAVIAFTNINDSAKEKEVKYLSASWEDSASSRRYHS